jgi:hypothetical protein
VENKNRSHYSLVFLILTLTKMKGTVNSFTTSPVLLNNLLIHITKSNSLVYLLFTRPLSLVVEKVEQNYIMIKNELNVSFKFFYIFSIISFFTRSNPSIGSYVSSGRSNAVVSPRNSGSSILSSRFLR